MLTGAELPCSLIFYFYSRGGRAGRRWGAAEGGRLSSRVQAQCRVSHGARSTAPRSRLEPESSRMLNWPSHPDTPNFFPNIPFFRAVSGLRRVEGVMESFHTPPPPHVSHARGHRMRTFHRGRACADASS